MQSNPLVTEVLVGLTRPGKAQLDYLGLLLLQAVVLFLWWPRNGIAQALENQYGPRTLSAVVMAAGLTTAFFALRAGTEEILLPGQQGLRDWARATHLRTGRIVRGYVLGQLLHSVHLLTLSSPLLLMAFTISGGEWIALGWCLAAVLVQALFYRLCGAITQLVFGNHSSVCTYTARTILVLVYVPVGLLAPVTSHLALTHRALDENVSAAAAMPNGLAFVLIYSGLIAFAALAVHRLLSRKRNTANDSDGASVGEVFPG